MGDKLSEREVDLLSALQDKERIVHDYLKRGELGEELEREYEKKLINAPLVGCGAGFVLIASSIATGKVPQESLPILIPSLWSFLFGIFAILVGGFFYVRTLSFRASGFYTKNNGQINFLKMYDTLRHHGYVSGSPIDLSKMTKEFNDTMKICHGYFDAAAEEDQKADKNLFRARVAIFISIVCFVVGAIIPLWAISIQYNFIWQ